MTTNTIAAGVLAGAYEEDGPADGRPCILDRRGTPGTQPDAGVQG